MKGLLTQSAAFIADVNYARVIASQGEKAYSDFCVRVCSSSCAHKVPCFSILPQDEWTGC